MTAHNVPGDQHRVSARSADYVVTPRFYNGKWRMTEETLELARRSPTTMAAWVLREIVQELIERRAEVNHDADLTHIDGRIAGSTDES